MIDLHTHVLPALDDGPPDEAAADALARMAVEGGTMTMVATPHVSWDYPHVSAALIHDAVDRRNDALRAAGLDLEVRPGAEIAHTRALDLPDEELTALHLGGGPWLLLECPLSSTAAGFEQAAATLAMRGHRIVLAHPERSPAFQRSAELLERMVGEGMVAQVTAASLTGGYGHTVQDAAWRMLAAGLVGVVASDTHSTAGARSPALAGVLAEAGLADHADHLGRAVPLAILSGTRIPEGPPPPEAPPPSAAPASGGLLRRLGLRRA